MVVRLNGTHQVGHAWRLLISGAPGGVSGGFVHGVLVSSAQRRAKTYGCGMVARGNAGQDG